MHDCTSSCAKGFCLNKYLLYNYVAILEPWNDGGAEDYAITAQVCCGP